MPRRKLVRTGEFAYHLSVRVNNREEFAGGVRYAWHTLSGELFVQQTLHGAQLHAFVVMPNHFHLLASSPKKSIDIVMRDFLSSSTRILNAGTQRSGRVFGGRYFWSVVSGPTYYAHVMKYVLRNPVKARLSTYVGTYPYSSYAGEIGAVPLPIAISPPPHGLGRSIPVDPEARDKWLNEPHEAELNEAIRKGLRLESFHINPCRKTRRKFDLEL
jgi:REP element-mobilizing transposase RayT